MTATPKVLISDKMSPEAEKIFKDRGIDVTVKTDFTPEELREAIKNYDGLAVRSSTKPNADILASAAGKLKVIGRAGIGVDNIDINAATQNGIIVMNTPFGNSITTAEHAIAMMMSLVRQIPQANASTHAGKWEKSKFMGKELFNKTLGVIGCGNIGAIVATRALGLKMKVIAYDPFLSDERAVELGVKKVELDELFANADIVTIHTPLIDQTRGLINAEAIQKMKQGVYIINCARGGLVVEKDLKDALDNGHVAGAALDVFEEEPAKENILFGHEKVICTPHLGASTTEAQENVALQVAEQISDFLLNGTVVNSINMPAVSAEDAPKLKPYMQLAEKLGTLLGQLVEKAPKELNIEFEGGLAHLNTKPLTSLITAGFLKPSMDRVNIVSAPMKAKEYGISVSETKREDSQDYQSLIRITAKDGDNEVVVAGTTFGGKPCVTNLNHLPTECALTDNMIYIVNEDTPGLIGALGTALGKEGINIANFNLGRMEGEAYAVALIAVDGDVNQDVVKTLANLPQVKQARAVRL